MFEEGRRKGREGFTLLWNFEEKNFKKAKKSWKWGRESPNSEIELILNFKILLAAYTNSISSKIYELWEKTLFSFFKGTNDIKMFFSIEYGIVITRVFAWFF